MYVVSPVNDTVYQASGVGVDESGMRFPVIVVEFPMARLPFDPGAPHVGDVVDAHSQPSE
jgi:hypothetical protein